MNAVMEYYKKLVPFLGLALGPSHEVALLDCQTEELVAISNGDVSGRCVGADMTDLARKIIAERKWEKEDYITNYPGYADNNKLLHSSTFFIKEKGKLVGMLCINIDTTDYQQISEIALRLAGLVNTQSATSVKNGSESETFQSSISNTVSSVLAELFGESIPATFSRSERLTVLTRLQEKKFFLLKGAVPHMARVFGCSISTIYRELASHPMLEPDPVFQGLKKII